MLDHGLPTITVRAALNTPDDVIVANVNANIRRQLPQAMIYEDQDTDIILAGGGQSLQDEFLTLRQLRENGAKLVSMNGSHDWLMERDLESSAFVMIDARPSNAKFVKKPQKKCKYFIASQCDPSVLDALEGYDVSLFHSINDVNKDCDHARALKKYYFGRVMPVTGASTVMTRSMVLFALMGFRRMHVFGFDSCWLHGKHHAYTQLENEDDAVFPIYCADRWFTCSAFHVAQAKEFQHMVRSLGHMFDMQVYGQGLIAHMINESAELELDREC